MWDVHDQYGYGGAGRSYGPQDFSKFGKGDQMKTCHACGQKLPLKVGDMVEGRRETFSQRVVQGMVANTSDTYVVVHEWGTGAVVTLRRASCVRLHGYYRITEREAL